MEKSAKIFFTNPGLFFKNIFIKVWAPPGTVKKYLKMFIFGVVHLAPMKIKKKIGPA